MKSIRIGNDIRIEWPVVLSGDITALRELDLTVEVRPSVDTVDWRNYEEQPELHRREHTVMMNGSPCVREDRGCARPRKRHVPPAPVQLPYHIEDNTIIAMWTADRQFCTGEYDLLLYSHKNDGGQGVVDQYRFVRLVEHTAQADAPADSGVEAVIAMQPVTLELSGLSAYEVAVAEGYTGTREEWLESLKAPAKEAAGEVREDYAKVKEEWQDEFDKAQTERQETFDAAEKSRQTTFEANEKSRQTTFETNEKNRQDTFDINEKNRQTTFEKSETDRSNTFNESQTERQDEYEALKQKTEAAAKNANDAAASITDYQKATDAKIDALMAGAKITLTATPGVVYKGVATSVRLTAAVSGITPDSVRILDGSTEIAASTTAQATAAVEVTLTEDKAYTAQAAYNGGTFPAYCTVYARYPIYRGFGTSAESVAVDGNRLSARTSAAGTYADTTTADGQRYYILVPEDISGLTDFTMGGAPYVMTTGTADIGGISYKVYESGAVYNTGAEVDITAK